MRNLFFPCHRRGIGTLTQSLLRPTAAAALQFLSEICCSRCAISSSRVIAEVLEPLLRAFCRDCCRLFSRASRLALMASWCVTAGLHSGVELRELRDIPRLLAGAASSALSRAGRAD